MSLNLTYSVANKKLTPNENAYNSISKSGVKKAYIEISTLFINPKIKTITKLINKFIKALIETDSTTIA